MTSKTFNLVMRLFNSLSNHRKKSLFKLLPLAIITGISDVLVVALVSRLFSAIIGKENRPSLPFSDIFSDDPIIKVLWLVFFYISFNWIASFLRLVLRAFQEKLRAAIFLDLTEIAQRNVFNQNYEFFLTEKSENISTRILLNISRVSEKLIRPILQIVSGFFISSFIFIAIFSFAKITAFYLIICLVIGYLFISIIVTPIIRNAAKQRIVLESEISRIVNESIQTIIDVHLTNSEGFFQSRYLKARKKAYPYLWKSETLPEFPRSLIEPFGISLIFAIGLFPILSNKSSINLLEIIPFFATIAVASLKLTPPLQDLFRGITDLRAGIPDVEEALKIIEIPPTRSLTNISKNFSKNKFYPKSQISLESIFYKYPNARNYSLNNININIKVGSKVAFVGKTGSGKTTTANHLLCLLKPSSGQLSIDGIKLKDKDFNNWQSLCSYVPQSINLLNSDIASNIAYGLRPEEVDHDKVFESIITAQLEGLIKSLPNGIKTKIGQNGIRLSGGERQRIAIARAFYRDSKLLVLDEATSALDNKTESDLMKAVERRKKDLTIIFIAHRLSTVKECDCIYEFSNGKIKAKGNYKNLINDSPTFRGMINAGQTNAI